MMDANNDYQNPENNQISGGGFLNLSLSTVGSSEPYAVQSGLCNLSQNMQILQNLYDLVKTEPQDSHVQLGYDLPTNAFESSFALKLEYNTEPFYNVKFEDQVVNNQLDSGQGDTQPLMDSHTQIGEPLPIQKIKRGEYCKINSSQDATLCRIYEMYLDLCPEKKLPSIIAQACENDFLITIRQVKSWILRYKQGITTKSGRTCFYGQIETRLKEEILTLYSSEQRWTLCTISSIGRRIGSELGYSSSDGPRSAAWAKGFMRRQNLYFTPENWIREQIYFVNRPSPKIKHNSTLLLLMLCMIISPVTSLEQQYIREPSAQKEVFSFSLIQPIILFLYILYFALFPKTSTLLVRGQGKKAFYKNKQPALAVKALAEKIIDDPVQTDTRNRGTLKNYGKYKPNLFTEVKFTSFDGQVSNFWSAPMKGKTEDGICFVTAVLAQYYPFEEVQKMTRPECIQTFKTLLPTIPMVPVYDQKINIKLASGEYIIIQYMDRDSGQVDKNAHIIIIKSAGADFAHCYIQKWYELFEIEVDVIPKLLSESQLSDKPIVLGKKDFSNDILYDLFSVDTKPTVEIKTIIPKKQPTKFSEISFVKEIDTTVYYSQDILEQEFDKDGKIVQTAKETKVAEVVKQVINNNEVKEPVVQQNNQVKEPVVQQNNQVKELVVKQNNQEEEPIVRQDGFPFSPRSPYPFIARQSEILFFISRQFSILSLYWQCIQYCFLDQPYDLFDPSSIIYIPSFLKDFNGKDLSIQSPKNGDLDWINQLPQCGLIGVNILNPHPQMSLYKGQGTASIIPKQIKKASNLFKTCHNLLLRINLYSTIYKYLHLKIQKDLSPFDYYNDVEFTCQGKLYVLPLFKRSNFDSHLSYKIYTIHIGYNLQIVCINPKAKIEPLSKDGQYFGNFFVRREFLQYSQMKCLAMDFKNQKDQDAKFQMILSSCTPYTTEGKSFRDFNDPYGECLNELHMGSKVSNEVQVQRQTLDRFYKQAKAFSGYETKGPKTFNELIHSNTQELFVLIGMFVYTNRRYLALLLDLYLALFSQPIQVRGFESHISIHQEDEKYYAFEDRSQIAIPTIEFFDYEGQQRTFADGKEMKDFYKQYCSCGTTYPKRQLLNTNIDTHLWAYDKCVLNLLAGLIGRQGGGKTQPEPSMLSDFIRFFQKSDFVKDYIDNFVTYSLDDYMEHIRLSDSKKHKTYLVYLENFKNQLVTPNVMKQDITYRVFSKNGEYHISSGKQPTSKRSRNIFDPSGYLKVYGGWIAYNMKKNLSRVCKHYIGDMDLESKEQAINQEYLKFIDPIFISNDGDANDSRQHESLIKGTDSYLISQVINKIFEREPWLNESQKERIKNMVLSDVAYVIGFDGKVKVLKAVIRGTVFSGHPTRTTFGNTLRVIFYLKYAFYLAGITKYSLFVCGDDVLAMIESCELDKFYRNFYRVYCIDKSTPMHGLGQVTKGAIFSQ